MIMSYKAKVDLIRANEELHRLRAVNAELLATLIRIAVHEGRADRRHRGMSDVSEIEDMRRCARAAIAKAENLNPKGA